MKRILNILGTLCLWLGCLWGAAPAAARSFVHPGVLHTKERMEQIRSLVEAGRGEAYESYLLLKAHPCAQADYKMEGPFEVISRDGEFRHTKSRMERDFSAAYLNALMWSITGEEAHARKAEEVLAAYARTLKRIPDTNDAPLLAGLEGFKIVYALEVLKHTYPKLSDENYEAALRMFTKIFLPVLDTFYKREPYTNGNWGAIATKTYMAAAIHLDDEKMYEKARAFYLDGKDNGTLEHYIDGATGQIQESGRDQSHCMLGLGAMATVCELAWQQGDDLYSAKDNRLLKGYEYVARYNLGYDVPFTKWTDITGKYCDWDKVAEKARGRYMFVFDIAYNHYVNRMPPHALHVASVGTVAAGGLRPRPARLRDTFVQRDAAEPQVPTPRRFAHLGRPGTHEDDGGPRAASVDGRLGGTAERPLGAIHLPAAAHGQHGTKPTVGLGRRPCRLPERHPLVCVRRHGLCLLCHPHPQCVVGRREPGAQGQVRPRARGHTHRRVCHGGRGASCVSLVGEVRLGALPEDDGGVSVSGEP